MRIDCAVSREARSFSGGRWRNSRVSYPPSRELLLVTLFVDPGLVDGTIPCLCHDKRAQYSRRRRRTLSTILSMALVRSQAYSLSAYSSAHATQPPDRREPDRGLQRAALDLTR